MLNPRDGFEERDDIFSFFSFSNNVILFNITNTSYNYIKLIHITPSLLFSIGESISHGLKSMRNLYVGVTFSRESLFQGTPVLFIQKEMLIITLKGNFSKLLNTSIGSELIDFSRGS